MNRFSQRIGSHSIDRRHALQLASAMGAGLTTLGLHSVASDQESTPTLPVDTLPVTGEPVPELAAFDTLISTIMRSWNLPGGQLAIAHEGRLVYNRGFGWANVEDVQAVEPDNLFRIASTSKPITAVAILKLVDQGEIALDTPIFPLLALEGPPNAPYDLRLDTITVEQLLLHSGGWNSAAGYDPQYQPWTLLASHVLDAESPVEAETIIRYMLSQPLDFDPGTLSAYSNFGFNVLGRVVEHLSGQSYEQFTIDDVLAPAGIASMAIGGTTLEERMDGEVKYYSPPGLPTRESVYPDEGFVPVGYGSYYLPSLDAHGGWIASAQDLLKFTLAIDGQRGDALLSEETVTALETTARPPSAAAGAGNVETSLGLGWNSAAVEDGYEWSHAGALEGSNCSWLVRKPGGLAAAFVFNSLPTDFGGFFNDLIPALQEALAGSATWPETDLFG
jgi:N-acyl-D-amino-acid deacylase